MTYGVAVITAAGLFTLLSSAGTLFGGAASKLPTVYVALALTGVAYLVIALTVLVRASRRSPAGPPGRDRPSPGCSR